MTSISPRPLGIDWKDRLGLAYRQSPELYESAGAVRDVPHAAAIRAALEEMGLSAVFCVQGVPTVAILATDHYDRGAVVDLHGALWNQGLASLLLVIANDTLRVFSLARTPMKDSGDAFERRCLIEALSVTAEALRFQNLIYGAESGRLWRDHGDFFKPKERIDQVLLDNLNASHALLQTEGLSSDSAQALLIQAMLIAYLEDRQIVTPAYFAAVSENSSTSFLELLTSDKVEAFRALFQTLRADFNGDLFVAPCSFETDTAAPEIGARHMAVLARFRSGREEMAGAGQQRFWGYDFRYIPIELVSAVYDRFLGEREEERRAKGAYYTPMFLADTVVSQVWELLSDDVRINGRFLDPACGSGVFLVRSFQRLCEHWRLKHQNRAIPWKTLQSLLSQIHGWDLNGGAVRVAVFSLYVALLEEVSPRDIRKLITRGKILPELWGRTLVCRDFFDVAPETEQFEVIIGNPPWTSRRGPERSSVRWSKATGHPMPGREDAWAFSWKALAHLADQGTIAFLLPSMGFLHNHAQNTVDARDAFFKKSRVRRVINFADLRFQLFEKAHRPTALIIYGQASKDDFPYAFDYWAPKADLNLRIKRVITLSSADRVVLDVASVFENSLIFKQRLWMREPDAKLFGYLARLPKIGAFVTDYGSLSRKGEKPIDQWVIGQGYQPYTGDEEKDDVQPIRSAYVGKLPDLPVIDETARRLFAMAKPIAGTLAEAYLHERGIADLRNCTSLRYHPRCFFRGNEDDPRDRVRDAWPALIASVTGLDGKLTGAHRTWLDPSGMGKAPVSTPRRAMGLLLGNGVRFGVATDTMAAGEGIETMLSLRCVLPSLPMVAALSANHLAALVLPPTLRRLYLARDDDPAGRWAVETLATRANEAGIEALTLDAAMGDLNEDLRRLGRDPLAAGVRVQLAPEDVARFFDWVTASRTGTRDRVGRVA